MSQASGRRGFLNGGIAPFPVRGLHPAFALVAARLIDHSSKCCLSSPETFHCRSSSAHHHRGLATIQKDSDAIAGRKKRAFLSVANLGVLKYPHR
jgi:hypothetical protein